MKSETCAAAVGPHVRLVEAKVSDETDEIERSMTSLPGVLEIPLSTDFIFPYIYRYLSKPFQDLSTFHSISTSPNLSPPLHQLSARTKTELPFNFHNDL
jgi:hypothetical protein